MSGYTSSTALKPRAHQFVGKILNSVYWERFNIMFQMSWPFHDCLQFTLLLRYVWWHQKGQKLYLNLRIVTIFDTEAHIRKKCAVSLRFVLTVRATYFHFNMNVLFDETGFELDYVLRCHEPFVSISYSITVAE